MALKWEADQSTTTTYYLKDSENNNAIVATITGLKPGLSLTAPEEGVKEIAVTEEMIDTENGATVSISGDGYTLTPSFGDSVAQNSANKLAIDLDMTDIENGNAKVVQPYSAYYSAKSKKISYTPARSETLATISNLVTSISVGNGISLSGNTVTVTKDAVSNTANAEVTLTNEAGQSYKLGLDTAVDNKVGFETQAAAWELNGNVPTYKSAYTGEGWTLNGNTVTHTAAETPTTLATISGSALKDSLSTGDLSALSVEGTTITVGSGLLQTGTDKTVTVTGTGYTLTVADSEKFDYDAASQTLSVAAADGTDAKITRPQQAGWSGSGTATLTYTAEGTKDLATITGVKAGATGVTVAGKVVTLAEDALGTDAISIADANPNDEIETDKGFTLELGGEVQTTLEDDTNVTVAVDNGTATVKHDQKAYWTLGEGNKSVSYTAASSGTGTLVATVTGLKSDAVVANITADPSAKTITLAKAALNTAQTEEYEINVTGSEGYSLVVNGVNTSAQDNTESAHLASVETVDTTKKAIVKYDQQEYWTGDSSTKITYHPATEGTGTEVATVTGLADTASTSNVSYANKTITLSEGAVGTTDIALDDTAANNDYKLALNGINQANNVVDTTVTLKFASGTATVNQDFKEYWKLTEDKAVAYHAKNEGGGSVIATVSGLEGTPTGENVKLEGNIIKLYKAALSTSTAATLDDSGFNSNGYRLALHTDVDEPNKDTGTPYLAITGEAGSKGIEVRQNKTTGWEFTTDQKVVEYKTPAAVAIATITGLGDSVNITSGSENVTLSEKIITLSEGALKQSDVTLTNSTNDNGDSYNYKLALNSVTAPVTKPNSSTLTLSAIGEDGKATVTGTTTAGWTLDTTEGSETKELKVTYSPQETKTVVELEGLKTGATINTDVQIVGADGDTPTIKLTKNALNADATKPAKLTNKGTDYTFKFDTTGIETPAKTIDNFAFGEFKDGTATITGTKSAGWTTTDTQVTYTAAASDTVATVKGLKADAAYGTDFLFDDFTGNFTIKKEALTNSDITLTTDYDNDFALVLQRATSNVIGGDAFAYWTKYGTTAEYYTTSAESWEINAEANKITHTPMTTGDATRKATITNLSSDFTLGSPVTDTSGKIRYTALGTGKYDEGNFVAGASVEGETITLSKNVLGTGEAMTYTLTNSYKLNLNSDSSSDGYVRTTESKDTQFWELGTTAKLKKADLEYWTKTGTDTSGTISYTPRGDETLLATITGLSSEIKKDDLTVADTAGTDGKYAITLNAHALAGRDVNINSETYKLALNTSDDAAVKVAAPELSNKAWSLNDAKTIATYKADVTEGYEAASDGSSITYTEAETDKTIAEVSGLNGNEKLIVNPTDKQSIGIDDNGTYTAALSFGTDANAKQITLTKDVLDPSNVKVTGTNYTLKLEEDTANGIYLANNTNVTDGVDVWRVDGTTATYKKVKYAHYGLNDTATELIYTPEADVAEGLQATVKGLKSGLTVATNGQSLSDGSNTEVVKLNSSNSKQIDLKKEALGTTDILLDGTDYKLSLGDTSTAADLAPAMDESTLTWSVDGTTAKLNGLLNGGYTLGKQKDTDAADANNKITYTETNPNYTFATLTGIKSGLTNADLNVNSNNKPIAYDFSGSNPVITLNSKALGTTPVALDEASTNAGYTLALDDSDVIDADDNTTVNVWAFKDGTATYQTVREAYYDIPSTGDNKGKIIYNARAESGTKLAEITGLKSGLTAVDGKIEGITPDNESAPTQFTISASVLGTSETPAKITMPGSYTFKLDAAAAPVKTSEDYWTIDGTTAKYQFDTSAGYTQTADNADIVYKAERKGTTANTIVEISNLKSGLKKATVESNIVVGDDGTFTLNKNVLGTDKTNPATLTPKEAADSGLTYKLALESGDLNPQSGQAGWKVVDGGYALHSYTTAGYTVNTSDNKKIDYREGVFGDAIAKVTGLKTNLTPNTTTAQIVGITLYSSAHTITVSKSVLTTVANTPAKIETETGADQYSFVLGTDVAKPAYSKKWTASKGTATLTENITLGYTIPTSGDNEGQVVYQPKKTVTTTISGLKTTVAPASGNQSITGITLKNDDNTDLATLTSEQEAALTEIRDGTFHVDSSLLNDKTVTLTNKSGGGSYQLVLDGATIVSPPTTGQWYKADNATVATYEKRVTKGYVKEDSNTKYTYYGADDNNTVTTLATLKGLTKTVTAAQLNAVIAHTAPVEDNVATDVDETAPGKFTINSSSFATNNLELSDIFGKNKLTLASTDYELAFDNDDNFNVADINNKDATWTYNSKKGTADLVAGKTEGWAFQVKNDITNYKTILYTKAAPKTIASVSGLKTGLTLSANKKSLTYTDEYGEERQSLTASFANGGGDWVGKESSTPNATIEVDAGVLTNKNVTVTPKQTGYTFAFDVGIDVYEPKDTDNYWATDGNGKAFYRYDTSAGYELGKQKDSDPDNANNKITYSAFKTTTLATISGLATAKTVQKDATKKAVEKIERAEQLDGITVTSAPVEDDPDTEDVDETASGVFTLWDDSILTNKVTLGNKDNYKFEIANEIAIDEGTETNKQAKWYFSNGTATYKLYDTKGYTTSNDRTAVFKNETASTTLLTLKGLAKKIDNVAIKADDVNNDKLLLVNEDNTVTISDKIKADATITLVDGTKPKANKTDPTEYYQYTIDTNSFDKPTAEAPVWTSISKGTATLKQTTSAGYTLSDTLLKNSTQVTGQKLTYSKAVNPTIATVKGLATNLAIATATNIPTDGTQTVGAIYTATTEGTGKNAKTTIAGTTPVLEYDATTKVITVNKDALAKNNVTVSGNGGYKLALGSDINNKTAENTTEWVVSGTEAKYKNYDKAFYALSGDTTIKYTADTAGITYATVKGLKSGTTIDTGNAFNGNKDGGVLTLKADNLGEKTITIASNVAGKNTFTLALADDTDTTAKVSELTGLPSSVTANNKGTATIKGKLSKGFTLEFGGKQLTYNNTDNKDVTVATVTGLKNGTSVEVSSGTITLDSTDLANKNVAVTTSWGTTPYTLSYTPTAPGKNVDPNYTGYGSGTPNDTNPLNPKNKTPGWTISGTTGTLKGYVTSEGYTMSDSGTTLTYTGATQVNTTKNKQGTVTAYTYKDTTTLATIKGLKNGLTSTQKDSLVSSNTITLNKSNTNGNLTINGGTYAVVVADNYTGKSITGSAGADDLTVNATGKTITGGKGDDKITFVENSGNTFVYNNGDGNDVIANFTAGTDKLQVNSGAISVGKVGSNVVVKVGAGSINLGSYSGTEIDIYAKDGKTKTTYAIAGATGSANPLLEDNNYSMDAASLSDLVQGDSASFTPYDFSISFSLTKEDKLTPQISYSGSDKK